MGSGQSKFKSNRQTQYPYGAVPGYPNPYAPHPFQPYPQPMYPQVPQQQGFIPPGAHFGQGAHMPPPQLNWLPQDKSFKKRKSRRTQSERFVGGFAATGGQPQPECKSRLFDIIHVG